MTSLARPADRLKSLTPSQVEEFMRDGFTLVRGAFPRAVADELLPKVWKESPFKADDRKTWDKELTVVPKSIAAEGLYSPRVIGVIDDLLGEGRYSLPSGTGYLVLNMPGFAKPPWRMFGGHVDGN